MYPKGYCQNRHGFKIISTFQVIGEDLVSCLFSKNWNTREIALKQLGQIAIGCLILGVGEGRTGVVLSSHTQATTHSMLECCCSVLAYMCADPVYKVFVAGLVIFVFSSEIKRNFVSKVMIFYG